MSEAVIDIGIADYSEWRAGFARVTPIGREPAMPTAESEYGTPVMPRPERTIEGLRRAITLLAPHWLPEMDRSQREATATALRINRLDPLRAWLRHWAAVVEIERHPDLAFRYHRAEQVDTISDDAEVRARGVRVAEDLMRAAYAAVET
ncbi:hypothetical protein ACFRCG_24965 [Embleya sp. NPDC056575]|uniref:hypothetical protein n=1 Tax=unclassified Embleya TaxID=2699296 RepID=UPI00369B22C5